MFCLPKQQVSQFVERLRSGEITPENLIAMTSAQRREFFGGFLDPEAARRVNVELEKKLILKNQQKGILNWARQVTGMKPEAKRDLIERVRKMDNILTAESEDAFLDDLVAQKLGFGVTKDEAGDILKLSKATEEAREKMESSPRRKPGEKPTKEELEYGRAAVAFSDYTNDLKYKAEKTNLSDLFRRGRTFKTINDLAGQTKSLSSSMDNSAIFRQGWKTMWTNPSIWRKNAGKTFKDIWDTFGGKETVAELNARIISDPNYPLMRRAKLAVGSIEEAFPNKMPENVPVFSKAYKASQDAYSNFLHQTRADVFNKYLQVADNMGLDVTDETFLKEVGRYVNALTGRSDFGKYEGSAVNFLNNAFFSPRLFVSHFETLLSPLTKTNAFVRKQAATNILKMAAGFSTVLAIANAINPDMVEWDARSSDFGKIKVGKTRFDVSGGMGSILVLATRLMRGSYKSSTTGAIKDYGNKFGEKNEFDAIIDFGTNKLSPAAAAIVTLLKGRTYDYEEPTALGIAKDLYVPLGWRNVWESAKEEDRPNLLILILADALGIGTSTY